MPDERVTFERMPRTQRVSWFLDMHRIGNLELSPPYQRRQVWSKKYKQFFIDSVIRNFPTASIFLAAEIDAKGRTVYEVIDGKQRLTAILEFVGDAWPTPDSLDSVGLGGVLFSALPDPIKKAIFGYIFTIEEITHASATDLDQVFERLNRNTQRLNKQELRNSQYYNSEFLTKFEALSEHPFWMKAGVVTLARAKRMLDVELVSELYVLTDRGIQEGNDYLDSVYAEYDDGIAGVEAIDERFDEILRFVENLNDALPLRSTRLSNNADFYSLWAALLQLDSLPSANQAADKLGAFLGDLEKAESEEAVQYLDAARQGSNKKTNRELRARLVLAALASAKD